MLFVVASMEIEIEGLYGLDKSGKHWSNCDLVYTGIGRENVRKTLKSLLSKGDPAMEGILSVGFVGSIDPEVKPGDLCLADRVKSSDREGGFIPDSDWRDRAGTALEGKFRTCGLLTVEETASSVEGKRSLRAKGASVIDQETYWVAKEADERDLPFLSIRVVFDGINQDLPPARCYDSDSGKVLPGKFVRWLAEEPSGLKDLPRLGWNSLRARSRLTDAVNCVLPALRE